MQPIWGQPALVFETRTKDESAKWLAVSELHIGYESGLARKGAFLKSQTRPMLERLLGLAGQANATSLLILGDVKQNVVGTSAQERRDVPAFFDGLSTFDRVVIARGNHDARLESMVTDKRHPNVTIAPASGLVIESSGGNVGALHGHAWPKPALLSTPTILVGHTHAAARLINESGRTTTEWAWVRGRINQAAATSKYGIKSTAEVIVFPPFNPLLGGAAVNVDGLLGPMRKLVDASSVTLTLLDGRSLGRVRRH